MEEQRTDQPGSQTQAFAMGLLLKLRPSQSTTNTLSNHTTERNTL